MFPSLLFYSIFPTFCYNSPFHPVAASKAGARFPAGGAFLYLSDRQ